MFATKSCLRMMNLGHRISRGGYLISSQDCIQSVKEIINSNIMFYYYYSVKDFRLINRWDITHCTAELMITNNLQVLSPMTSESEIKYDSPRCYLSIF